MSSLLKISDAVSIGLHALIVMAGDPRGVFSTVWLARNLGVSRNHLVKVLQRLNRAGLVRPMRGPRGGYVLAESPVRITLRRVLEALEGRLEPAGCLRHRPICGGHCVLAPAFRAVNRQLVSFFTSTNIAELAARLSRHRGGLPRPDGGKEE